MAHRADRTEVGEADRADDLQSATRADTPQTPPVAEPPRQRFDADTQPNEPQMIERQQALLREITTTLLITLVLFVGLHYSAQAVPLDGPSMQPGLHTDERVLVNSLAYTFHGPQRGDVVVLNPPTALNQRFIKRVIGLPGDTITLTPDNVIVNGVTLNEPYITPAPPGESENPEPQIIRLNENQYFVMGDNRSNSQDSRFFGPITQREIVGQAEFVVWPLAAFHQIDTYPNVYSSVPDVSRPLPIARRLAVPALG
jgi:signal peptidase I